MASLATSEASLALEARSSLRFCFGCICGHLNTGLSSRPRVMDPYSVKPFSPKYAIIDLRCKCSLFGSKFI